MRVALSIMLMQECCNPVANSLFCQWENEPGGEPIRIKHLLHSSAVRYGECNKSYNNYIIVYHQSIMVNQGPPSSVLGRHLQLPQIKTCK